MQNISCSDCRFRYFPWVRYHLALALTLLFCAESAAFSLLGPRDIWQTPALGYNPRDGEFAAPKNLGEEYRWNLPVITYGFDRAFMDYFGPQGIRAVEEAIEILNNLPPASEMDLSEFPLNSLEINPNAESARLMDLRSTALALLVEQLGLAAPERWAWALRDRFVIEDVTNYTVLNLNFDPVSFEPSSVVNDVRYGYQVLEFPNPNFADAVEFPSMPGQALILNLSVVGAVGDIFRTRRYGEYFTGLTRDDAGGIRYLYHPLNINFEPLPSGIVAEEEEAMPYRNAALRPGLDKVTFRAVDWDWDVTPDWNHTIHFTDRFFEGTNIIEQRLVRTIERPDILFSAGDLGVVYDSGLPIQFLRTINFTNLAGWEEPGPGIMQPGPVISFASLNPGFSNFSLRGNTEETGDPLPQWGSFARQTDLVIYPAGIKALGFSELEVALEPGINGSLIRWLIRGTPAITYTLQRSTDLKTWDDVETFQTESGQYTFTTEPQGTHKVFYRTISTEP